MIIRKVRGKEQLHPIMMTVSERKLAERLGIPLDKYVSTYLMYVAKERRWKWFFKKLKERHA